ncbi:MAG: CRISPR-associated endonuclease Cas2 [Deltaproteobacteria bacterium]|nr:CRISPR-associated endonuclease Cas2 [Deltaproteobacteria bacterium]
MRVLITYDVSTLTKVGRRRLRRIAQACVDYGQRVQLSVFECTLDKTDWVVLKTRLFKEYDPKEDSMRFYFLCEEDYAKTEHNGVKQPIDLEGPLIV